MLKLAMTISTAAIASLLWTASFSDQAKADGWRHHRHHHPQYQLRAHRWGDNDYEIIRWSSGDCKIWHDDDGPPWGVEGRDWLVLVDGLRSWDEASGALGHLQRRRGCA